jgi:AcrR family transcriptional regulator
MKVSINMKEDYKKSKKYADILLVAKKLIWKHGVKRVSIEEICKDANVSKMTFYRYFANKTELVKVLLNMVVDESIQKFRDIVHSDMPPNEKLKMMIMMKMEGNVGMSKEFMNEFYLDKTSDLAIFMQQKSYEAWKLIIADIQLAQENGIIRKDLNAEFFFAFSLKLPDLLKDNAIQAMFETPSMMINEIVNLIIYGIANHE